MLLRRIRRGPIFLVTSIHIALVDRTPELIERKLHIARSRPAGHPGHDTVIIIRKCRRRWMIPADIPRVVTMDCDREMGVVWDVHGILVLKDPGRIHLLQSAKVHLRVGSQ